LTIGYYIVVCLCVCVCLSVTRQYSTEAASQIKLMLLHSGFLDLRYILRFKEIGIPPKITALSSVSLPQTLALGNLPQHADRRARAVRYKQATAVGLLLSAPGDDSQRDQIPVNRRRRSTTVDHARRPDLYKLTGRWSNRCEAASRGPSALFCILPNNAVVIGR